MAIQAKWSNQAHTFIVDHEFQINLADGEPSERFFLHFNARLADLQRLAQGSASFLPDGEFVSRCSGTFEVAGAERPIEWRVATSAGGGIRSVFIATPDEHGDNVREVAEVLVRDSLASALSDRANAYIHRMQLAYVGPALAGEFWLSGLRFAPAIANDHGLHRMDFERIVYLDFQTRAIDSNQAGALARKLTATYASRLACLLQLHLDVRPHEWIWIAPTGDAVPRTDSERKLREFYHPTTRIERMPRKGELCPLAAFQGSVADRFPRTAADLIALPEEARAIFRIAARAPRPEALAIDAASRMYSLSLVLQRYSASALSLIKWPR